MPKPEPTALPDTRPAFQTSQRQIIPSTISCTICHAAYTPSPAYEQLRSAPPKVVEAAFMSVCHFCFRCRQPGCPQCWDAIHGICGACVQEVKLPFRKELAPLDGVIFPPKAPLPTAQGHSATDQFTCVHPGRFLERTKSETALSPLAGEATRAATQKRAQPETPLPSNIEHPRISLRRPSAEKDEPISSKRGATLLKTSARLLTILILTILLTIVLLIVLVEVSDPINVQIAQVLHIDIRAEIAYILHLV